MDARLRSWPHVYCDQEKKMISEASFNIILRVLAFVICFTLLAMARGRQVAGWT